MESIKRAVRIKKSFIKSQDIDVVIKAVNDVKSIYDNHLKECETKEKEKDFSNVNGVDFNVWAYCQEIRIKDIYFELKSKYYDLHFDKFGFNAY
jgi:hypothetical protein